MFARNGGSGLSVLTQSEPNRRFVATWEDARGSGLQDGVAVMRAGGADR
ncbi:hypothetical protein [Saccharothrix xinjiangensis]|uniref:Uncharacterized protein n=1 Tax=Saccharothrix xinjiangensis TaxID=204798 RepID=A0ABV9Y6U4_9PSEU